MFNKRKKKQLNVYVQFFINNKDSFLNIFFIVKSLIVYISIYIFRFCGLFLYTKVFSVFKGLVFFFKTTTAVYFFFVFQTLKHNTKYKRNLLSAFLHIKVNKISRFNSQGGGAGGRKKKPTSTT